MNIKPSVPIILQVFFISSFILACCPPDPEKKVTTDDISSKSTTSFEKKELELQRNTFNIREFDQRLKKGMELHQKGAVREAINWYLYALQSKNLTRRDSLRAYSKLQISYNVTGNFMQSMNVLVKGLQLTQDSGIINGINIEISHLYMQMHNPNKALSVIDECVAYCKRQTDTGNLIRAYVMKAWIHAELKESPQYLEYNLMAYNLAKQRPSLTTGFRNAVYASLNNIASAYIKKHMPDSALFYLKKIDKIMLDSVSAYQRAVLYSTIGNAFIMKQKPKEAIAYFNKALALDKDSLSLSFYNARLSAYKSLAHIYATSQQYAQAWHYQKLYIEVYEKAITQENSNKISQIQNQYTIDIKDHQLTQKDLLLKNNSLELQQKNVQVYYLLLLSTFAVVVVVVLLRNYTVRKRLSLARFENLEREKDISVITATLQGEETERERIARELHDSIVSEVSILKMSIFELGKQIRDINSYPEYKSILKQSESIKGKIRQVAHDLVPVRLQQLGLHKAITTFADRLSSNALRFHFQAIGNPVTLAPQKEKVVFMMIQELAQNILKHAHATEATIQLNYFDEALSITIEDNGVGIGLPEHRREGMGLRNIRHYVEKLDGSLDMHSSEYIGTTILIELPLHALLAQEQDKTMH